MSPMYVPTRYCHCPADQYDTGSAPGVSTTPNTGAKSPDRRARLFVSCRDAHRDLAHGTDGAVVLAVMLAGVVRTDVRPADERGSFVPAWEVLESARPDAPAFDPVVHATYHPRSPNQGYLNSAPDGIDAEFAWTVMGGAGAGQRFVDLE